MRMGPLTKIILVLTLVAVAVGALFIASRDWSDLGSYESLGPSAVTHTGEASDYSDPLAAYQRWRNRLSGPGDGDAGAPAPPVPPAGRPPAPPPAPRTDGTEPLPGPPVVPPETIDLTTTSRDEGLVVAGGSDGEVAGADPPGPVLRPEGIEGDVVVGPLVRPSDTGPRNSYVIQAGDTLYGIAMDKYGDARFIQAIEAANPGLDPNRLRVGDRITLPEKEQPKPKPAEPTRQKVYVVRKGDTLIAIAREVYGDAALYPRIYEANKDVLSSLNARLYPGMRLRLPEP